MVEIIFREIATDTEGNIYQERGQRTMRIDGLEKGMKEKRGRKKVSFTRKKKKKEKKKIRWMASWKNYFRFEL